MSIYDGLKHRKTALMDATGLTDTVISHLYPAMQDAVITRQDIIENVIKILDRFDKAAASHYKAFHPL